MKTHEEASGDAVEGSLDSLKGDRIVGWAWHPSAPAKAAIVELVSGEDVIAVAVAVEHRGDLAAAGKRGGACGFEFFVTEGYPTGVEIRARVADGEKTYDLVGGPIVLAPSEASPRQRARTPPLQHPVVLSSADGLVGYIEQFGPETIRGWAYWRGSARPVRLSIDEGERTFGTIVADAWRPDLAERRQGDGRGGIDAEAPLALRDGQRHVVDLKIAETGQVVAAGIAVRLEPPTQPSAPSAEIKAPPPSTPPLFSFIVVFYNMHREAERTLTSLSRAYQRGVENIAYEVLCVDNGSSPALDRTWVESFGPEFRLAQPSEILPSPCQAINEAARSAKGRYVAIMIDGAHVLTPGVLREAADALLEKPEGIVAIRQWWLGGDQRWLSSIGYTREMEDILFARIAWPRDGYKLFRVGAPILESPVAWFDEMAESNCLFLPAELYQRLGGIDESFDEPGAGFANLDLFRRAADAAADGVISLVGEASFHQFHGGTTTNVDDDEKDKRVRAYASRYRDIRGEAFGAVTPDRIFLRGRIRRTTMYTARQRPWFTGELGVTERLRPASTPTHFDPGMQLNLQGSYAECELFQGTVWAGRQVRLAPADLVSIQAMLDSVRPGIIVTTSRDDGLIHFLDTIRGVLALTNTKIVRVLKQPPATPSPPSVHAIVGDPYAPATLAAVEQAIGDEERVVVLFGAQDDDYFPDKALEAYARFVSVNAYLVFLGTVLGQPWLGYSRYWFAAAIRAFLRENPEFVVDPIPDQQVTTLCIGGYLQRARPRAEAYDASLDVVEGAAP